MSLISNAISSLQRVKNTDGTYSIVLPINTIDEVIYDNNTGTTLTTYLDDNNTEKIEILDDMANIMIKLSPLINGDLQLNHLFRTDFKTINNLQVNAGTHKQGCLSGSAIEFKLMNPIPLKSRPSKIKIQISTNRELVETDQISVFYSTTKDEQLTNCSIEHNKGNVVNVNTPELNPVDGYHLNILFRLNGLDDIEINDFIMTFI